MVDHDKTHLLIQLLCEQIVEIILTQQEHIHLQIMKIVHLLAQWIQIRQILVEVLEAEDLLMAVEDEAEDNTLTYSF